MAPRPETLRETDDEARRLAVSLMREAASAALATAGAQGAPFCSLTGVATDMDGAPVLLVSGLSAHTANLARDPRCSLLFARTGKGDPLAHPRLTVVGAVRALDRGAPEGRRVRARFLRRQPKAALYADFPDFTFLKLEIASASLNGGFGKAYEPGPADLLTALDGADPLIDAEDAVIAHMNEDHGEAVKLCATRLAGRADGPWRLVSLDPDGIDLAAGQEMARLPFARRVNDADEARAELAALARAARAA